MKRDRRAKVRSQTIRKSARQRDGGQCADGDGVQCVPGKRVADFQAKSVKTTQTKTTLTLPKESARINVKFKYSVTDRLLTRERDDVSGSERSVVSQRGDWQWVTSLSSARVVKARETERTKPKQSD
jgi:hypothetical protein